MAFLFRKRIKILPGVHLNIGKKGMSVSAGVRGASVTVSSKRITQSVGIPGTGISSRTTQSLVQTRKRTSATLDTPDHDALEAPTEPARPPSRAAYSLGRWLGRHWLAVLLVTLAAGSYAYLRLH